MRSENILNEIRRKAIKVDWTKAFSGKSKGNKHLYRIVKIARHIAENMNADIFIVEAGALLHDLALPSGNDYDYIKNKRIAKKFLNSFNLENKDKDAIAECVAAHEGTVKPKSLEAKIVHDADVLEKSGVLGIIRHTWKMTNSGQIDPKNVTKKDIQKIVNHIKWREKRLYTPLAKKLHKRVAINISDARLKKIIPKISKLAQKSIITEDIADIISKDLKKNQQIKLKQQLNLKYFRVSYRALDK